MIKVIFIFNEIEIIKENNLDEKMREICNSFSKEIGKKIEDLYFLYYGEEINYKLFLNQLIKEEDKNIKKMNIIVYEKNKKLKNEIIFNEIICPICGESIILNIKEYKIRLYECKNGHTINNILFDEFEKTQKKIINKNENLNNQKEFYECNTHKSLYIKYCLTCKINICEFCEINHKNHNIIEYKNIKINENELRDELKNLRIKLDLLKNDITKMIKILNKVKDNMEIYYKINYNIINNYKNKKINYQILQNINEIRNKNKIIIDNIDEIISCNYINSKFENILNIYDKMITKYEKEEEKIITIKYKINKNNNLIKIFNKIFVNNNKNICKILYMNKEYKLKDEIDATFINKDILELKLKGISDITNISYMFCKCPDLLSISDIPDLNPEINNLSYMFFECKSLKSLPDISKWNINNIINISYMFYGCSSLQFLPDISKWNTDKINNMSYIFCNCSSLLTLPDISKWNINKVFDLDGIFLNCKSLLYLPDISKWDTSNVEKINFLFSGCSSLIVLPDLSKWDTCSIKEIEYLFNKCYSLSFFPDISKWKFTHIVNKCNLFDECINSVIIP